MPYYIKFTDQYPTVNDLALATDEDVFRIWQGLGYYNRCKNMLATARFIHRELKGKFPNTHEGLLALKGIGPYTAAAIASFAFGLPHAVVDGNVYRVLSRYMAIELPIDSTEGKKVFAALAQDLIDPTASALCNQAIMDLGATVCTPRSPKCGECPIQHRCAAYRLGLTGDLPVKHKKVTVNTRYFHYLLLEWEGCVWLQKRGPKDIWENLHQPYLIEAELPLEKRDLQQHEKLAEAGLQGQPLTYLGQSSQRLTHRIIKSSFYRITLKSKPSGLPKSGFWLPVRDINSLAFPKTIIDFFRETHLY